MPSASMIARDMEGEETTDLRCDELFATLMSKADFTDKEKATAFDDMYDHVHDLLESVRMNGHRQDDDEQIILFEQLCKATHGPSFFEAWNSCPSS